MFTGAEGEDVSCCFASVAKTELNNCTFGDICRWGIGVGDEMLNDNRSENVVGEKFRWDFVEGSMRV